MKYLDLGTRLILAVLFILFGASKFYAFMPTPQMTGKAALFLGALLSTGYLWPFIGALEIIGGIALVAKRTTNLGIILLGPIIVNIVSYLLILQNGIGPAPIIMSIFLVSSMIFLVYRRRQTWWKVLAG